MRIINNTCQLYCFSILKNTNQCTVENPTDVCRLLISSLSMFTCLFTISVHLDERLVTIPESPFDLQSSLHLSFFDISMHQDDNSNLIYFIIFSSVLLLTTLGEKQFFFFFTFVICIWYLLLLQLRPLMVSSNVELIIRESETEWYRERIERKRARECYTILNRLLGTPNPFRYRCQLMPYYLPRWIDKGWATGLKRVLQELWVEMRVGRNMIDIITPSDSSN